ncbi:Ribose-phosphate pyrophosphokinase 1, chloroplastic [Vitis vinifera]|uniref:ribose-phosphate diphosphokinase n=1 Tax=Vitis vinifera TaxID=29760 RepID=A0A438JZK1_VITVI|nr:Ribose-phosphate pyrophosphokinase 1, chloroplastic [Vitis vinifera]
MASLSLSAPSYHAESLVSRYSLRQSSFLPNESRYRFQVASVIKCDMNESLKFENGKPCVPVLNDRTFPSFLESRRMEKSVSRNSDRLKIFSGTANPTLSKEIAWYMGKELGKINIKRFADGEIYVQLEESVRGCDVYLVQPTCPPANENLMELLIMIDACRRASAKTVTAVVPYFGYARSDRKATKLVANVITKAGADRVLACDLHSGQSMGYLIFLWITYIVSKTICCNDLVVVSPDVGGVARARAFAKKLSDAPLAIVDKRRQGHNVAEEISNTTALRDTSILFPVILPFAEDPLKNSSILLRPTCCVPMDIVISLYLLFTLQVMNLIGDVKGKVAVMVDDMIDTAGTITKGAALLHQEGAREVYACCTHAVFSPPAIERLTSGLFQEVIITNTIPTLEKNYFPQLTVLSVANLLGETIWRIHDDCSVSSIFL